MRESTTYQHILQEGRVEGAQHVLLHLARKQFGEPDAATAATLRAITDLDRLERMAHQVFHVASWQDWLQTP